MSRTLDLMARAENVFHCLGRDYRFKLWMMFCLVHSAAMGTCISLVDVKLINN